MEHNIQGLLGNINNSLGGFYKTNAADSIELDTLSLHYETIKAGVEEFEKNINGPAIENNHNDFTALLDEFKEYQAMVDGYIKTAENYHNLETSDTPVQVGLRADYIAMENQMELLQRMITDINQ